MFPTYLLKRLRHYLLGPLGILKIRKQVDALVINKASIQELRELEATVKRISDYLISTASEDEGSNYTRKKGRRLILEIKEYAETLIEPTAKFVFIGGLHRSGTTILTSILSQHPDISSFDNKMIPENEGQFLQTVYPPDRDYGGPGLFGFYKEAHLTENSELITEANRDKLLRQWSPFWDIEKSVFLEKSPSNLLRTRFLQQLFPNSKFIIVRRHPIAAALATQKWSKTSVTMLINHLLRCYETWDKDKSHIKNYMEVTYEQSCQDIGPTINRIFEFIGIESQTSGLVESAQERVLSQINEKYFAKWRTLGVERRLCELLYGKRVETQGYDLKDI